MKWKTKMVCDMVVSFVFYVVLCYFIVQLVALFVRWITSL